MKSIQEKIIKPKLGLLELAKRLGGVRRLMAEMGQESVYKRLRKSQPHPECTICIYFQIQMMVGRPSQPS